MVRFATTGVMSDGMRMTPKSDPAEAGDMVMVLDASWISGRGERGAMV